jgi:FtsP/CotA-like multicopper oxidase with cupredoxin domain
VDLGAGAPFTAWLYNGRLPGPEIRLTEGQRLRVKLVNRLPEPTTIHWHGLPVPNAMDGVPGLTQEAVPPGESFVYEFEAQPPGTYIYHSHQAYQLDRGLYGALIVEPKRPRRSCDREYTLVLEDWAAVDGGGPESPRRSRRGMMGGMGGVMGGSMGGGMMGRGMMGGMRRRGFRPEVRDPLAPPVYDAYAVNGRSWPAGPALEVRRGERVRLRLCNPSSASIYDLALAGHRLTVTHTDGRPVRPLAVDVVRLSPGERLDVEFTADNPGRWLLMANDRGWGESGLRVEVAYRGVQRARPEPPAFRRDMRLARYQDLQAAEPAPPAGEPGPSYRQVLSGGMHSPWWTINGRVWPEAEVLRAPRGRRVRLGYLNRSHAPHPMHLHGHFFRLVNPRLRPERWLQMDTVLVEPMQRVEIEFLADNPGRWFHHCHNLYHLMAGMANEVRVG